MRNLKLLQQIGDLVCDQCGPHEDCGVKPEKCALTREAGVLLDGFLLKQHPGKALLLSGLKSNMTKSLINGMVSELKHRISQHKSGEMPLIDQAIDDYAHDLGLLVQLGAGEE